jgi:SAM-dependent methyltransferase
MSTGYESEWERVYGIDKDPIRRYLVYPALDREVDGLAPRRVVDAGCGNGGLLAHYRNIGFDLAIGFDTSSEFLEAARLHCVDARISFISGDLAGVTPIEPGWADLAFCVFVLNEVQSISAAIRNMSGMLCTGGKLVVVMTHPFQLLYEVLGHNDPWKLRGDLSYFQTNELEYNFTLSSAKARYYHHNFGDIIEALSTSKLGDLRLRELSPNGENFQRYPQYWNKRELPLYLLVTATKL